MRNSGYIHALRKAKESIQGGAGFICYSVSPYYRGMEVANSISKTLRSLATLPNYVGTVTGLYPLDRRALRLAWIDGMIARLQDGEDLDSAVTRSLDAIIEGFVCGTQI